MISRTLSFIGIFCTLNSSFGQMEGSFEASNAYSLNLEALGINARSYLFLSKKLHVGMEFTHFFDHQEQVDNEDLELSANVLDLNTNYFFDLNEHLRFYTVLGFDYSRETEKFELPNENKSLTEDALGYNIGGGFEVPLSEHFGVLAEYTHTFSELKDNVVFFGLVYEWERPRKQQGAALGH